MQSMCIRSICSYTFTWTGNTTVQWASITDRKHMSSTNARSIYDERAEKKSSGSLSHTQRKNQRASDIAVKVYSQNHRWPPRNDYVVFFSFSLCLSRSLCRCAYYCFSHIILSFFCYTFIYTYKYFGEPLHIRKSHCNITSKWLGTAET